MLQRRQLGADFGEMVEIDFRRDDAGTVRELGENRSPGIDDHRVAVAFEAFGALAELIGGDDIGLVLDGAGAQQEFPSALGR